MAKVDYYIVKWQSFNAYKSWGYVAIDNGTMCVTHDDEGAYVHETINDAKFTIAQVENILQATEQKCSIEKRTMLVI